MNDDGKDRRSGGITADQKKRNQVKARAAWLSSLRRGKPGRRHRPGK